MLKNIEGSKVPAVTFYGRNGDDWQHVTSDELFSGKRVIVFSLPGAFTPTCSSRHLPRYNELAESFKQKGIDGIVCMSVNDGFVMEAWQQDQDAEHIRVIPDGNGEFTEGMGMLVDKSDIGFGKRSWRYSMLVNDGVVEKMFIEPDEPGDPFHVSDADTMMQYLSPNDASNQKVSIITRAGCPFCQKAKTMLSDNGFAYEEIELGQGGVSENTLIAMTGRKSAPQVFIDGNHIGGSDDLATWMASR